MEVKEPVELRIRIEPGKQPEITGPLADKLLCYALIGLLTEVVQQFKPEDMPRIDTSGARHFFMHAEPGKSNALMGGIR